MKASIITTLVCVTFQGWDVPSLGGWEEEGASCEVVSCFLSFSLTISSSSLLRSSSKVLLSLLCSPSFGASCSYLVSLYLFMVDLFVPFHGGRTFYLFLYASSYRFPYFSYFNKLHPWKCGPIVDAFVSSWLSFSKLDLEELKNFSKQVSVR